MYTASVILDPGLDVLVRNSPHALGSAFLCVGFTLRQVGFVFFSFFSLFVKLPTANCGLMSYQLRHSS